MELSSFIVFFFVTFMMIHMLKILIIIMGRIESHRKFGLPRGRNLPFTLESRKGNYGTGVLVWSVLYLGNKIRNVPHLRFRQTDKAYRISLPGEFVFFYQLLLDVYHCRICHLFLLHPPHLEDLPWNLQNLDYKLFISRKY